MVRERVYVHGGGRRGVDAWPHVDEGDATFVSFPAGTSIDDQAHALADELGGRPVMIFAHSIGAVPVALATPRLDIAGLVLIEPALYDLARGDTAIERHIGIVTKARSRASAGDLRGFWAILRPLMFGGPFEEERWSEEQALAQRWASINLPWGHGVRDPMLGGAPTLVVTGGWNDEYEVIAQVLADHGATHRVLPGHEHRPHDSGRFVHVVDEFVAALAP